VRRLLSDAKQQGAGQRYLIEHSAGSGKSNSIAWLAHQLVGLQRDGKNVFDSVVVVTDRRVLDKQSDRTIKSFAQIGNIVGHADVSGDLKKFLASGKKIIVTTIQQFPVILGDIGCEHKGLKFAIIIDEAHSSQGGKAQVAMSTVLRGQDFNDEELTIEDKINEIIASRKMLSNASYFAFTATPKNKTLELFGVPYLLPDGTNPFKPFHSYTMKQAIQEGFILDVLKNFTMVRSYYKIAKTIETDPLFDTKKAYSKLHKFVESHDKAIRIKSEIMIDHFISHVVGRNLVGGQARAMVVTNGIMRAIDYFHAFQDSLKQRKSQYKAIVAFSGQHEYKGQQVTEAIFNGFSSNKITDKIIQDPFRFLIVADKFQTGYDEPLLHTMYVVDTEKVESTWLKLNL
jgi:type I restriction enzyme R subunit